MIRSGLHEYESGRTVIVPEYGLIVDHSDPVEAAFVELRTGKVPVGA